MIPNYLFCFLLLGFCVGQTLENRVYKTVAGNPCIWLLDNQGGSGCHTTKSGSIGILKYVANESMFDSFLVSIEKPDESDKKNSYGSFILVLPERLLGYRKFLDFLSTKSKKEQAPKIKVAGIIFINSEAPHDGFSPTSYTGEIVDNDGDSLYPWNPTTNGNNFFHQAFPFPLWSLGVNESADFQKQALENENRSTYPFHAAEMFAFMHPQTIENSILSLARGTSQPISGHSTWTSINPIPPNSTKPIILAVASMDSASLFPLKSVGANDVVSGLVSLMATLDALLSPTLTPISNWEKSPVFAWLDGESWGHLGSVEFMHYIFKSPQCTKPENVDRAPYKDSCEDPYAPSLQINNVHYDNIHSIIEVKQVGSFGNELFIHQAEHNFSIPVSKVAKSVGKSLNTPLTEASLLTVGLPPSCVKGFKRVNQNIVTKSIVITDHNEKFKNKYYKSIFDTIEKVDPKLVCASATLVARTLSALGRNVNPETDPELLKINANCSLVNELLDCFGRNTSCALRRQFHPFLANSVQEEFPSLYTSVRFRGTYSLHQSFVHDWVFDRVNKSKALPPGVNYTACSSESECQPNESCVKSICQLSITYYHEATNLNVKYVPPDLYFGYYEILNKSLNVSIVTESNWDSNYIRVFQVTDPSIDYIFLGVAMSECLITLIVAIIVYKFFNVKYKIL